MNAEGTSPSESMSSMLGEVIAGRYRITKKLGEGGMGEVFAAEHVHIEKKFAMKLLRPEIVSNPEAVKRFYQEARSASSIGHRNIIAIDDFGELGDGRIYMCMELLNGAPLNELIKQPMSAERLLNILIQTGHGLAAAHQKNIIHRDMKPENIFVTVGAHGEDIPKLLDFGIAKVAGNEGQNNLTRTGTIFGTPFYMAPEQALGQGVDARADIYAMGVIMYEVFSGSLPFQGESFMGILTQHITTAPEPVAQRAAAAGRVLPPGLAEVITCCMQKDPAHRFASVDALVAALVEIYRRLAGSGMSSYMEAFVVPRTGPVAVPDVRVTPNLSGHGMIAGSAPYLPAAGAAPPAPTPGPMPVAAGSASASFEPAKKSSKVGVLFAVLAVLVVVGGAAAFVLMGKKESGGSALAVAADDGRDAAVAAAAADAAVVPVVAPALVDAAMTAAVEMGAVDAAVLVVDAAPAPDAPPAVTPPPTRSVVVDSKKPLNFTIWEDHKQIGNNATGLEVTLGSPRTLVLKAKGYKDATITIDGTLPKVEVDLQRIKASAPDGPTPPPVLDCTRSVKDPRNPRCIEQYCSKHVEDPRYCLE